MKACWKRVDKTILWNVHNFQRKSKFFGNWCWISIFGPQNTKNGHSLTYSYLSHWEFVWNVLIRQASCFFWNVSKIIAVSQFCRQYISNETSINLQPQCKLKLCLVLWVGPKSTEVWKFGRKYTNYWISFLKIIKGS